MNTLDKIKNKAIHELEERYEVTPTGKQLDIISTLSDTIESLTIIQALEDGKK